MSTDSEFSLIKKCLLVITPLIWNPNDRSSCLYFANVKRTKRIKQNSKIKFNYFLTEKTIKGSMSNQDFDDLLKMVLAYKPSHHQVLSSTFQCPNCVQ